MRLDQLPPCRCARVTSIVPCSGSAFPTGPAERRALELHVAGESLRRIERATGIGRMRVRALTKQHGRRGSQARATDAKRALHQRIVEASFAGADALTIGSDLAACVGRSSCARAALATASSTSRGAPA